MAYSLQDAERIDTVPFEKIHAPILEFLPTKPSTFLDLGAGTGRDAAFLAAAGHTVLAIEPNDVLREFGESRHTSSRIRWLNDSLPDIFRLQEKPFDFIWLAGVWAFLELDQRTNALNRLADFSTLGTRMMVSLKHDPRASTIRADDTIAMAASNGFRLIHRAKTGSVQAANEIAGVTWTKLVFEQA